MSKITIYPELFLEEQELNRMIKFLDVDGFKKLLIAFTETFGIIRKQNRTDKAELKVYNSSYQKLGIYWGSAFDSSGNLIHVDSNLADVLTVPDDSTYRKVFIQYATTQVEVGTIAVASNGSITGTNTLFTEVFKSGKIIEVINSTLGNNGSYAITAITSDTSIATGHAFTAESGINYKVKGVFTPGISIADGSSRPYWLDTVNVTLENDSATSSDTKFYLARVINTAGVVTITDIRTQTHLLKQSNLAEIANNYTTAANFYVGADIGTGANGKKLLTADDVAPYVLNSSSDVMSNNIRNFKLTNVSNIGFSGDSRAYFYFQWGFGGIEGHTDGTEFHITHNYDSLTQDDIVGQYINLPGYGNFRINSFTPTSAGVTVITSLTAAGTAVYPVSTQTFTASNPCYIHPNALKYTLRCAPVITGVEQTSGVLLFSFDSVAGTINDINNAFAKLFVGTTYNIKLSIMRGTQYVEKNLPEGYISKFATNDVHYNYPWTIVYPNIADDGAISAKDVGNKIHINIDGWDDADDYEVVYTSVGSPDFNSNSQPKIITANKSLDITVDPAVYQLAVRPRCGKQQVQTPKTSTVTVASAGDGKSITDTIVLNKKLNTFSGTISTATGTTAWGSYRAYSLALTSVKTPSGGTNVPLNIDLSGLWIKDHLDQLFLCNPDTGGIVTVGAITIIAVDVNAIGATPATGTFTIGTDINSREVNRYVVQAPMTVLAIEATTVFATLGDALFRVYNLKDTSTYDTILLPSGMKGTQQAVGSGNVSFNTGETYVATMYDSGGSRNTGCFNGSLKIILGDNKITVGNPKV